MRAVKREHQARERSGLTFGIVGSVGGRERRILEEAMYVVLGVLVMAS